jgi:hypothetical protein
MSNVRRRTTLAYSRRMLKIGTLWIIATMATVALDRPKTVIGLIAWIVVVAVFWAWLLHKIFPEPSNMGGMPESFKRKAWDEHFGRDAQADAESPRSTSSDPAQQDENSHSTPGPSSPSSKRFRFDPEAARKVLEERGDKAPRP